MPIGMQQEDGGKALKIALVGTVVKEDYKPLVTEFSHLAAKYGKVRVLLDMTRFHGWDASALWQEIKFDLKNLDKLERLAVIGEARWQHAIASIAKPFTEVRYFHGSQILEAQAWLNGQEIQKSSSANAA